jgi:radical SAM superfamily enzyme YgiQ (UPF0313 family)
MELAYRKGMDAFAPTGDFRRLTRRLREHTDVLAEIPAVVLACFDRRTRMMPFVLYDKKIFPAGARTVAGTLVNAGFSRTRAVFQLWNPNFRPSAARIDGRPPQILLISAMQIHSHMAYAAVRDAWTMGEDRPLILVGGPKSYHEPYHYWPLQTPQGPVAPDAAVTGEAYILLDLLDRLMDYHRTGEHIRKAFERARKAGALGNVPGLIYLDPQTTLHDPVVIDSGLPRLIQHLDEFPDEEVGLSVLEPPHRGAGLSPRPLSDKKVGKYSPIGSLVITQGCKFNCSYCPIPALNQKTWRYRSPENLVRQFQTMQGRFGMHWYFGADDNFMNRRQTAEEYFEALAKAPSADGRKRLGRKIRWGTEATQYDTYRNKDLLPLARRAGLFAIWFGIEDLTAELINKGQKPECTVELFQLMHKHKICPMAMMMFHAGQPFHTPNSLYGLSNQMEFLRKAGAISLQVTLHVPAVGTREYEPVYDSQRVLERIGAHELTDSTIDGNHVLIVDDAPPWKKQLQHIAGYFAFYNPVNLWRSLRHDGSKLRLYRMSYQALGFMGVVRSAVKMIPYTLRLMFCKKQFATMVRPATSVPVRLAPKGLSRFPNASIYERDRGRIPLSRAA